jgi:hypothetical protein
MEEAAAKVFGIGLSKTGTTSLTEALQLLGFRAVHYPPLPDLLSILRTCDAATDTSVACMYKELDLLFPGSKFILTVRDQRTWLASAKAEFQGRDVREVWKIEVRKRLYSSPTWNPKSYLAGYQAHNAEVARYFTGRKADFLRLNLFAGQGWPELCGFLGRPVPRSPFPHSNVTSRRPDSRNNL